MNVSEKFNLTTNVFNINFHINGRSKGKNIKRLIEGIELTPYIEYLLVGIVNKVIKLFFEESLQNKEIQVVFINIW